MELPSASQVYGWLPSLPILGWLPKYKLSYIAGDLIAGLTVGLMVVPQSLAFAKNIANLPAQYGLYSSFMSLFVYALLGTSKDLSVGPTSILSLIVAGNCASVNGKTVIEDALFLSFFAGILQLGMGLLHLGVVVDLISEPVITGFLSSAGLTIAAGQLKHLFGVTYKGNQQDFFHQIKDVINSIHTYRSEHRVVTHRITT
jgi:MFS superfamily sulfate permease-like transporter